MQYTIDFYSGYSINTFLLCKCLCHWNASMHFTKYCADSWNKTEQINICIVPWYAKCSTLT